VDRDLLGCDPEYGGSTFSRNVCMHIKTTRLYPRKLLLDHCVCRNFDCECSVLMIAVNKQVNTCWL
jgi:hypothetical protein